MIIKNVLSLLENASGPVVKLLQRGEHGKVIVLGFKKGMLLKEHKTSVTTKLVIVAGMIVYKDATAAVTLHQYDEQDIPVNLPHSVEALEDSICFLIQV